MLQHKMSVAVIQWRVKQWQAPQRRGEAGRGGRGPNEGLRGTAVKQPGSAERVRSFDRVLEGCAAKGVGEEVGGAEEGGGAAGSRAEGGGGVGLRIKARVANVGEGAGKV